MARDVEAANAGMPVGTRSGPVTSSRYSELETMRSVTVCSARVRTVSVAGNVLHFRCHVARARCFEPARAACLAFHSDRGHSSRVISLPDIISWLLPVCSSGTWVSYSTLCQSCVILGRSSWPRLFPFWPPCHLRVVCLRRTCLSLATGTLPEMFP